MILPFAYAPPRLTVSQHALPIATGVGFGAYDHLMGTPGLLRSSAYTRFGNGVTRYMVLSNTSGAASCPFCVPSENVQASRSLATLSTLIWSSGLKRVFA